MKKKEIVKLKTRSLVELEKDALELREKLWEIRREIAGGKIKNVKQRRTMKKDLARILTVSQELSAKKDLKKEAK